MIPQPYNCLRKTNIKANSNLKALLVGILPQHINIFIQNQIPIKTKLCKAKMVSTLIAISVVVFCIVVFCNIIKSDHNILILRTDVIDAFRLSSRAQD